MAIRGQNVGTAVVKVIMDGSGISDDLRRELEAENDTFNKAGRDHEDAYAEGRAKSAEKNRTASRKRTNELFKADGARIRVLADEAESDFYKNIERNIRARTLPRFGDEMVARIKKSFVTGGGYDVFGEDYKDLFREIDKLTEQFIVREDQRRQSDLRSREDALIKMTRMREKYEREQLAIEDAARKQREAGVLHTARLRERAERETETEITASLARLEKAYGRVTAGRANENEDFNSSLRRTEEHLRDVRLEIERTPTYGGRDRDSIVRTINDMERGLGRVNPRFSVLNGLLDRMAPRLGRAFGRGSRSDLVNFFGASVEGSAKLIFQVPKVLEGLFNLGRGFGNLVGGNGGDGGPVGSFIKAFREAPGLMNKLAVTGAGASRVLTSLGTALASSGPVGAVAAAVAIVALVGVLGVLVAALSSAVAWVVALTGSVAIGLVGALGVALAAVLPLVAGLGVLTAGIISMSDAQKKALKDAIRPLTQEFGRLGRIGADAIFSKSAAQATRLSDALKKSNMEGLVRGVGEAISDIGDAWIDAIDSPSYRRFIRALSANVPDQLRALGNIAANTAGGLGGIFVALQPSLNRFLDFLEDATARFSAWANSAEGSTSLMDFFDRASDSAAALGGFLKSAVVALGQLLSDGQSTGDTILNDLADQFDKLTRYLRENPDAVGQWFEDGLEFGRSFGRVIKDIIDFIDALDTPENRKAARALFDTIGVAVQATVLAIQVLEPVITATFRGAAALASGFLYTIGGLLKGISSVPFPFPGKEKIAEASETLLDAAENAGAFAVGLDNLGRKDTDIKLDDSAVKDGFEHTNQLDSKLRTLYAGAAAKVNKGSVDGAFNAVVGLGKQLSSLASKEYVAEVVLKTFPGNILSTLSSIGDRLADIAGNYTANVRVNEGSRNNTPRTAIGGVFDGEQLRIIAERGKEAVVPLDLPLNQVDPSVRALAAYARGDTSYLTKNDASRSVVIGDISVVTPSTDPEAVADELLNTIISQIGD